jgi:hypothetical protein
MGESVKISTISKPKRITNNFANRNFATLAPITDHPQFTGDIVGSWEKPSEFQMNSRLVSQALKDAKVSLLSPKLRKD